VSITSEVSDAVRGERYVHPMATLTSSAGVGPLLRDWRSRRRLSQMELALDADVSARHLSFVETGRSKPSRELLLQLAEHLEVPLRERNALLLAAGYAPAYAERPLGDEAMAPVLEALERLLKGHEPFPAVAVDRQWELVSANAPALALLTDGIAPHLLEPPANTLRISLHPEGLAPRIVNLAEYSSHLLHLVDREAAATGDPALVALREELAGYPGVDARPRPHDPAESLFIPLRLRGPNGAELSFFSTIARFGTALDVTVAELAIESFFPADEATAALVTGSGKGV
jgi:transcriptional regulator with XRE-family HTH domain